MTVNKEILLQRIDELCKKKNINRTTAFNESGVGKNFRSNLSKCDPSEGKITMLANYFGTTVDYLIGNTDTPEPLRSPAPVTDDITSGLTPDEVEELKKYAAFLISKRDKK